MYMNVSIWVCKYDNWLNILNTLNAWEVLRIMTYDLPNLETARACFLLKASGERVKYERVYPCIYTGNSPSFGWRIFQINFYLPSIVPENWGLLDSR